MRIRNLGEDKGIPTLGKLSLSVSLLSKDTFIVRENPKVLGFFLVRSPNLER
jgi:hypothetical protein